MVLGMGEALSRRKNDGGKDSGDPYGIHKAFAEAGSSKGRG